MTTRLIQREEEWDGMRPEWDALHRSSPQASPPLHFDWLRSWWRIYGPRYGTGGLRIVTAWRENHLVGAVPLYLSAGEAAPWSLRCLRLLSTGEDEHEEVCPDYLNLLGLPGEEEATAAALWEELARMEWDVAEFLDVPAGSALLEPPAAFPARPFPRGTCPVANITGGLDAYLGRLSSNTRQQARRLLREGERAGAHLELGDPRRASQMFDTLMALHQERWTAEGEPGVFAAQRFVEFHRTLVREWIPTGRALLAQLSVGGEPVAVLYGFVSGRKFDFYQSGVRRSGGGPALRSPGNLAHLLLMRALSERGLQEYDFLRGSSAYKERLATGGNELAGVRVHRRSLRALGRRAMGRTGATVRVAMRRVRGTKR